MPAHAPAAEVIMSSSSQRPLQRPAALLVLYLVFKAHVTVHIRNARQGCEALSPRRARASCQPLVAITAKTIGDLG